LAPLKGLRRRRRLNQEVQVKENENEVVKASEEKLL
jgi:hypothetical protein